MSEQNDEVTDELRAIYARQEEEGFWLQEWARSPSTARVMAAAGCLACAREAEEEHQEEIPFGKLTFGDCMALGAWPGSGDTREEACLEAIAALKERHPCFS